MAVKTYEEKLVKLKKGCNAFQVMVALIGIYGTVACFLSGSFLAMIYVVIVTCLEYYFFSLVYKWTELRKKKGPVLETCLGVYIIGSSLFDMVSGRSMFIISVLFVVLGIFVMIEGLDFLGILTNQENGNIQQDVSGNSYVNQNGVDGINQNNGFNQRFCRNCGRVLDSDEKFCRICGMKCDD